jgi:hypothetical protein
MLGRKRLTEKIIDKIRKLIAHERSAREIGSIDEAAAFAARIQQLLFEHKLSMSEIEMAEDAPRSPVGEGVHWTSPERIPVRRRADRWYQLLFLHVAEAHFCKGISAAGYNYIYLIGREEDRAIAVEMFRYLLPTMKRLASSERRLRKANRRSVRNFTNSFYRGFITAIYWRYSEARRQADQTESTALVLSRSDDEAQSKAAELHPDRFRAPKRRLNRINSAARRLGWQRGNEVSLSPNVMNGASPAAGLLEE